MDEARFGTPLPTRRQSKGVIGTLVDSYHDEIALCYAQICDHPKPSAAVFSDLEEFATPLQIIDAVYRLVISYANNGAQGEYAEVQSFERREALIFGCTASP